MKNYWKLALIILVCLQHLSLMADVQQFPEFKSANINGAAGAFSRSDKTLRLTNNTSGDGLFFVFQEFHGNGQIIARVHRTNGASTKIGLLFRESTNAISKSAGAFLESTNTIFERVISEEQPPVRTTLTNEIHQWLRLVREGDAFSGFHSADGTNWIQFSADTIEMPEKIFGGLAIVGGGVREFENVQMTSARLASPPSNFTFVIPTNILIEANISTLDDRINAVEFFSGAARIGESEGSTARFMWTNALAGTHSLSARIIPEAGSEFFTEPVGGEIKLPSPFVQFAGVDSTTRGNWKEKYGAEGFNIILHATNYPTYAQVTPNGHKGAFAQYTSHPGALRVTNGNHRVAAHWYAHSNMTINVSLLDGMSHRISLYCQDWGTNARVQTINVINPYNGFVMDTRRVAQFADGKYYSWDVQGKITFQLTGGFKGGPLLSGIFFDPKTSLSTNR